MSRDITLYQMCYYCLTSFSKGFRFCRVMYMKLTHYFNQGLSLESPQAQEWFASVLSHIRSNISQKSLWIENKNKNWNPAPETTNVYEQS